MEDREDLPSPTASPALHGGEGNWVLGDTSFGIKAKGRKPLGRKNAWHGASSLGAHKMDNCMLMCVGEMFLPKLSVPSKIKEGGGGK